jgi:Right handed beta helix region
MLSFVLLPLLTVHTVVIAEPTLWVAVDGNDGGPGTAKQPLATIQTALSRSPAGHIMIGPGTYHLSSAVVLEKANTGAILEGTGPEPAIFSGAAAITSWEQVSPKLWRGRASMTVSRVWIGDKAVPSAKVPARYWHYITEHTPKGRDPVLRTAMDLSHRAFHPDPVDMAILKGLSNEDLADVIVTLWHSWEISKHRIARIDSNSNLIYLSDDTPWAIHEFSSVQRYQLDNVPGVRESSGNWYTSSKNWIYYQAGGVQDIDVKALIGSGLPHLLEIDGAQGITIRNIQFSFSGVSLDPGQFKSNQAASIADAAIMINEARGIRFERVTVSHTAGYGIWFRRNCKDSLVQASLIEDLGAGGIRIGETDTTPPPDHETGGITLDNNIIRNGGRVYPSGVGILIGRSGSNRITHNDIRDFYYSGISVGWQWDYGASPATNNLIENNQVHQIGQFQLNDLAGIYTLGESPGTAVRANIIYDVTSYPGGTGAWGLYADQASTGVVFDNNLVFRTSGGGFHQNFGKDNLVRGNVFAFGQDGEVELTKAEPHRSLTLSGNAMVSNGATFFHGDWQRAKADIDKNVYFNVSGRKPTWLGLSFADWKQQLGFDKTSLYADPGFVDARGGNFRLTAQSVWSWGGRSPIGVAGVYGTNRWRGLAGEGASTSTMSVPKPPDAALISIDDDFEDTPVGSAPANATVMKEGLGDEVLVSDEKAYSGRHSLKMHDVQSEKFPYDPHFFYQLNHHSGTTFVEFRLYADSGYCFSTEWRDSDLPYHIGPSLTVSAGQLRVGGKPIASIPDGQWISFKIDAQEGPTAERVWHLGISVPNGVSGHWTFPDPSDQWRRLEWLGFTSACRSAASMFIDDVKIQNK